MARLLALLFAVLAFACAAPAVEEEDEGSTESAIIGGANDTAHGSVAIIQRSTKGHYCTAELIAPKALLTAAHCAFVDGKAVSDVLVSFDEKVTFPGSAPAWSSGRIVPSPDWIRGQQGDIAIVLLDEAVALPRMKLGRKPAKVGTAVAVGYGTTETGSDSARRSVTIDVVAVTEHELRAGSADAGTCTGDSGGPLLQGGVIVGIVSRGPKDCDAAGVFTRVDDNLAFIDRMLGGRDAGAR